MNYAELLTEPGDCGKWIFSVDGDELYGHIVAGCPGSKLAYYAPASAIRSDIELVTGESITLQNVSTLLLEALRLEPEYAIPQQQTSTDTAVSGWASSGDSGLKDMILKSTGDSRLVGGCRNRSQQGRGFWVEIHMLQSTRLCRLRNLCDSACRGEIGLPGLTPHKCYPR